MYTPIYDEEIWKNAINTERHSASTQAWEKAIQSRIIKINPLNNRIRIELSKKTIPYWIKKGNYVSVAEHEDSPLIEAEIVSVNRQMKTCVISTQQSLLTIYDDSDYKNKIVWLLNYSEIPYSIMRNNVGYVFSKSKSLLAKQLLTLETVRSRNLEVIQGAPGTGKTRTIGEMCEEHYELHTSKLELFNKNDYATPKVLLTAFTHKACVNMAEELHNREIPFITLDIRGLTHDLLNIYDLKKMAKRLLTEENILQSLKVSASFLTNNPLEFLKYFNIMQQSIIDSNIFAICTAMSAPKRFLWTNRYANVKQYNAGKKSKPIRFTQAIVDEGSQIPMPVLSIIASMSKDLSVFGDPMQLPPVIQSPLVNHNEILLENPLSDTIFDKVPAGKIKFFNRQFRGRPEIFLLVSGLFYQGRLRTGQYIPPLDVFPTIDFIDSYGSKDNRRVNKREADLCKDLLKNLADTYSHHDFSVGVISPFRTQANFLREHLKNPPPNVKLDVGTVHVCQGKTYDMVIYSLAATTPSFFLNPPKEWVAKLNDNLSDIIERLSIHTTELEELNYPNYTPLLTNTHSQWYSYLEEYCKTINPIIDNDSTFRVRMFEDNDLDMLLDEKDFKDEELPVNEFAPNIFNVALSRARYNLTVIGNHDALALNPLFKLLYLGIVEANKFNQCMEGERIVNM